MSFADAFREFAGRVDRRIAAGFAHSVSVVETSIVDGHAITGAPGQPRDSGDLASSWGPVPIEPLYTEVRSNEKYAPAIEDGQQQPYRHYVSGKVVRPRPMVLRSKVGGFHSVKMTRAAWGRIVEDAVRVAKAVG